MLSRMDMHCPIQHIWILSYLISVNYWTGKTHKIYKTNPSKQMLKKLSFLVECSNYSNTTVI